MRRAEACGGAEEGPADGERRRGREGRRGSLREREGLGERQRLLPPSLLRVVSASRHCGDGWRMRTAPRLCPPLPFVPGWRRGSGGGAGHHPGAPGSFPPLRGAGRGLAAARGGRWGPLGHPSLAVARLAGPGSRLRLRGRGSLFGDPPFLLPRTPSVVS